MLLFDRNVTDISDTIQPAAIYCKVDALTPRLKPGVCALRISITITYRSGAKAFLTAMPARTAAKPAELPADLGDYRFRAMHALKLTVDLLAAAQPAGMVWRTVGVDGVHMAPCALEVREGGNSTLIRVTSGGAPAADTDPASFDGWTIPAGIS